MSFAEPYPLSVMELRFDSCNGSGFDKLIISYQVKSEIHIHISSTIYGTFIYGCWL